MEAADEAGDSDRWADLVLAATVPDLTALWEYDGTWNPIEIDHPGAISGNMLRYRRFRCAVHHGRENPLYR